ncbi:MAG TPA: peptidylprolyl isomerase, partial [Planctomycetaceae bacterium]
GHGSLARPTESSVVVAGSSAGSASKERTVMTADDRGDDDRDGNDSDEVVQPMISKTDEALIKESSILEFEGAGVKLKNGQVAATVNGQPIFLEDILRQLPLGQADWLAQIKLQAPPEQYQQLRRQVIGKQLPQHIERELLLQALKAKLKDDQLKTIQKQIDATFDADGLPHAMKAAGCESEAEFEEALRQSGSSIDVLREQFRNRELGHQYLGAKVLPKKGFDRPDVLKYYHEHKENYAIRAQAKWEQIRISYAKNGGKEGARKKADKILERLENDEDFAAIARECSDGPTASSRGGLRGWTTRGTLNVKEIEQALYEQPVGEIGPPIETQDSLEIVRVIERIPKAYQPFELVQDDIKTTLKNDLWQKATKALIKDLKEKATIETFIDKL